MTGIKKPALTDAEFQQLKDAAMLIQSLAGKLGDDHPRTAFNLYEAADNIAQAILRILDD